MTGVLGGFTTFSAFGVDTAHAIDRRAYGTAAVYVLTSVIGGIAVLYVAMKVTARGGS
jgi:CrcB protein